MPVILSQHFLPGDRVYLDVEGSLYHYPRQYFSRILPYDRFIYYRPLGRSRQRADSRRYFGHGTLGVPYPDPYRDDHRYVGIVQYEAFPIPVPLRDLQGLYYETGTEHVPMSQSAVRTISEIAYHRILAAAGVAVTGVSLLPNTERLIAMPAPSERGRWPKDVLRTAQHIPEGAGYVPHEGQTVDIYESAALQERARADHQRVLQMIEAEVMRRGGSWFYNNNIDLYATLGADRMLVEAKSLTDAREAVDRMRYGMGQLFDYRVRYRAEVLDAQPVLAFGSPPAEGAGWIGEVLAENGVAFVVADKHGIRPVNEPAAALPIFAA
ncbi:hypothetical protein EPN44_09280 [bacterium]|nr:MAG: hypothetical protein EPN44_09280 [bacterium]